MITVCPVCHHSVGRAQFSNGVVRVHAHRVVGEPDLCAGSGQYLYDPHPSHRRPATLDEVLQAQAEYERRGS